MPLMGYRFPKDAMDGLLSEGRILFGKDEDKIVELKLYARDPDLMIRSQMPWYPRTIALSCPLACVLMLPGYHVMTYATTHLPPFVGPS